MSIPKSKNILGPLHDLAEFARRIGANDQAAIFQKLHDRFKTEKLSAKQVAEASYDAVGKAYFWICRHIAKKPCDAAQKKVLDQEASRLKRAFNEALFPPKVLGFPETEIKGLAGNDESTTVFGDPKDAAEIAKQTLDVVRRFSTAVFKPDLETAYALCANELRGWMGVKRFFNELEKADQQFGGKPVDFKVLAIFTIFADEPSRQTANSRHDWPKDTPNSNKRARASAFWYTKPAENWGRWISFWITEEAEGYRIAKFSQFTQ